MTEIDDPALLSILMDAAVDAIVVTDGDGRILRANRAAAEMFQRDSKAMIGADVGLLMPADMASRHGGLMAHHMLTGEHRVLGRSRDVEGIRADGTKVPILLSLGRADTDSGAIFVSILHDQTEQRAMQEAAERSQKMDAIGRMTGGIAHDFNNLLTVIIGNLELLDMADLTERQRGLLADALSAADMGADLTSRLSVFARKSDLKATAIRLDEQVEQSLALMRHTIGTHCRITARQQPGIWPVAADASQLQTAILNLAMNSQDAMEEGGVLSIETQNVSIDDTYLAQELDVAPGRYVRLTVADTGRGMTPEERSRALEPFFTTKAAGHGTGLGLPMVYGFVKQSGGYLTIYSEPGEGTSVSLYFPALEYDEITKQPPKPLRTTVRSVDRMQRILIVEDDEKLRRLTEERLAALGFVCVAAETADEAWDMLARDESIALVFSDMVMPGTMSGFDLAQRIARERPEVAVLLTSGFSETVLNDRWVGSDLKILRKPYRMADLEAAVYEALGSE